METQTMSDEALLTEYLKTKDRELFTVLHERMRKRMYALAMKIIKSPETAEEIVQDVFCKLLDVVPQEIRSAESFLFRMVWTRALDHCREDHRGIRGGMISLELLDTQDEPLEGCEDDDQGFNPLDDLVDRRKEPPPESQVQQSSEWEEVQAALDRLTPKRREAIEAYYCRGFEINEIAEMEGVPYSTIRNRIRLGMLALRDALASDYCASIRRKVSPCRSHVREYANAV